MCVCVCVCVCVSEESLLQNGVKGMKKFYNHLKHEEEKARWEKTANMEDVEFLECQEEMNEQLFEQYTLVERVIGRMVALEHQYVLLSPSLLSLLPSLPPFLPPIPAAQTGDGQSQEYLCKWRGLPYSECTWEDSSLIADRFLEHIDSFLCRNQAETIPSKSAKVLWVYYEGRRGGSGRGGSGECEEGGYREEGRI